MPNETPSASAPEQIPEPMTDLKLGKKTESASDPTQTHTIVKGKSDWRTFHTLTLLNGVQCILVQDKESKTTAMSVNVNAGASCDPRELSGLAHFTEHMCFLGSEKYPGENEYKRYLSVHGGRSNASTSMQVTTYQFDVLAPHAEKAVDIFSNFFISPLFTASGTSREVNAVDSENSKNLVNDERRRLQIYKALADQKHHYSKFSTGHNVTLTRKDGEEMREALLVFHKRHYRPRNFVATIVGPQDIETLYDWVVPRFSAVVDRWDENEEHWSAMERLIDEAAKDAPMVSDDTYNPAFRPSLQNDRWPVYLVTLPLRERRNLVLNFPLPPVYSVPDRSPVSLISHLLGHEGKGSPFALLQNAGYISSLSSGSSINSPDQCVFRITISLTENGESNWKDVAQVIFDYCRLIHSTASSAQQNTKNTALSVLQRIWEEECKMSQINFHHQSPGVPYSFAPRLARSVNAHGFEKCVSAGSMLNEDGTTLPLDKIVDYSSRLVPTNCIVERCSKTAWQEEKEKWTTNDDDDANKGTQSIFGLQKEKWYEVEYYLSDIDSQDVAKWEDKWDDSNRMNTKEQLYLPKPNPYIPKNLQLCPELPLGAHEPRIELKMHPPKLILKNDCGRLWHKLDDRYALPKSSLTVLMRNAAAEHTHDNENCAWNYDTTASIHSNILFDTFSDALAQDTYDADLAGLYWSISKGQYGITLKCSGYSERIPDLAVKVLQDFYSVPKSNDDYLTPRPVFLQEEYFNCAKDRVVRGLRSFFQSGRADSHAAYYKDLLVSYKGIGVDHSLEVAKNVTLESLIAHHRRIVQNSGKLECLFLGNVSSTEAEEFFQSACSIINEASSTVKNDSVCQDGLENKETMPWLPGPLERRLVAGEDVEIHFQSKNPEEQNGAVVVSFQSSVPGYRGDQLSSPEMLRRSAAIRVLCHMLREPLFDELRTKQQLGYIVSSYYDLDFSTSLSPTGPSPITAVAFDEIEKEEKEEVLSWSTIPVESIVVKVLSRKVSPPVIACRIDEFLLSFRQMLLDMPESEIKDHSDALSKKMLKPIQKLGIEVERQLGIIRRYAPEILGIKGGADECIDSKQFPWDSVESLAQAIRSLERKDLIDAWDRLVADKNRARVVSHVYGKDFPMNASDGDLKSRSKTGMKRTTIKSLDDLLQKRRELNQYTNKQEAIKSHEVLPQIFGKICESKRNKGLALAALVGVGLVGVGLYLRNDQGKDDNRDKDKNVFKAFQCFTKSR